MKKILLISSEFPPGPGGIGRHAADLSLALNNKGFYVNVFSPVDYVNNSDLERSVRNLPERVKLYPLKRSGWKTHIKRIIVIFKELKRTKYEKIIVTGTFPLWLGLAIKIIYGSKQHVDFFVHGSEINPGNFIKRFITHLSLFKADKIWPVSNFTYSLLPKAIQKKKRVKVLPNGIHFGQWETYKDSCKISDWKGYPKLLTVGSVTPRKGQHRVIKALPEIIKSYPEVHYHIVGMPVNERQIRQLIETLKLAQHVTIHGVLKGRKELARAYQTADIFIMLSENQIGGDVEGFGIAILEANFFGKPAIGAIGCGIEDAIEGGINGEMVDGNDPLEIKTAIKEILDNYSSYSNSLKGRLNKYRWDTIIQEYLT